MITLIIGERYKIIHPIYNDDELCDIEIVEVVEKHKNSYLLKNTELNFI